MGAFCPKSNYYSLLYFRRCIPAYEFLNEKQNLCINFFRKWLRINYQLHGFSPDAAEEFSNAPSDEGVFGMLKSQQLDILKKKYPRENFPWRQLKYYYAFIINILKKIKTLGMRIVFIDDPEHMYSSDHEAWFSTLGLRNAVMLQTINEMMEDEDRAVFLVDYLHLFNMYRQGDKLFGAYGQPIPDGCESKAGMDAVIRARYSGLIEHELFNVYSSKKSNIVFGGIERQFKRGAEIALITELTFGGMRVIDMRFKSSYSMEELSRCVTALSSLPPLPQTASQEVELGAAESKSSPPPKEQAEQLKNQGNAKFKVKNYVGAIEKYDEALALWPEYAIAWLNKTNALFQLEGYQEALDCAKKAIEHDPGYTKAYLCCASLLIRNFENYHEAYAYISQSKSSAKYDEFAARFEMLERRCQTFFNLNNEGVMHITHRRYNQAFAAFNMIIAQSPKCVLAWFNLARAHFKMGEPSMALEFLNKAIELNAKYYDAYRLAINITMKSGDYSEALVYIDKAENELEQAEQLQALQQLKQQCQHPVTSVSRAAAASSGSVAAAPAPR